MTPSSFQIQRRNDSNHQEHNHEQYRHIYAPGVLDAQTFRAAHDPCDRFNPFNFKALALVGP
jgi:hypothetical protein